MQNRTPRCTSSTITLAVNLSPPPGSPMQRMRDPPLPKLRFRKQRCIPQKVAVIAPQKLHKAKHNKQCARPATGQKCVIPMNIKTGQTPHSSPREDRKKHPFYEKKITQNLTHRPEELLWLDERVSEEGPSRCSNLRRHEREGFLAPVV